MLDTAAVLEYFNKAWDEKVAVSKGELPAHNPNPRGYIERIIGTDIPEEGQGLQGMMKLHEALLSVSTHWQHPGFLGYFPSTMSDQAIVGQMFHELMPCSNSIENHNLNEAVLERDLVEQLRLLFCLSEDFSRDKVVNDYFQGGLGLILSTIGNGSLLLTHIAKFKKMEELKLSAKDLSKLVGYYPDYAHGHCVKAFVLQGIEHRRKIRVKYDPKEGNFSMDMDALKQALEEDTKQGLVPFLLFSAFGATSCCGIDDLAGQSVLAKQYGMMFAIDAAYTGAFMHLEKYAEYRNLVDLGDFYQFNLSKFGFTGESTSVFFSKDRSVHERALRVDSSKSELLPTTVYKLGEETKVGIYKIYLFFQTVGRTGFEKIMNDIESTVELIRADLSSNKRYEMFPASRFALICFRAVFDSAKFEGEEKEAYIKKTNIEFMKFIRKQDSIFMIGGGECDGHYFLRLSFNQNTTHEYSKKIIALLDSLYDQLAGTL